MTTSLLIALGVAAALAVAVIGFYNALVRGKNTVEEAWSGIDVQLRRRHDLVPNLVESVRQYANHERSLFTEVSEARSRSIAAQGNVAVQAQAENALTGALHRLFALAEAYPELKASENFHQLQESLYALEDEIQMARRYYNGAAREQNNRVLQFPGNLVARSFGFAPADYFELDAPEERAVPRVSAP